MTMRSFVNEFRRLLPTGVGLCLYAILLIPVAGRADEYTDLRQRWADVLTGGVEAHASTDPDIVALREKLIADGLAVAASMLTGTARTDTLFPSYPHTATDPSHIHGSYGNLVKMALAYRLQGGTNVSLKGSIFDGLDWLNANRFRAAPGQKEVGNWWEWEIGTPLAVNDVVALMGSELSAEQVANNMAAIDFWVPDPTKSKAYFPNNEVGANLAWKAFIVTMRGVNGGAANNGAAKISSGRDALVPVLDYVTTGDGFYADGSFIQHGVPYNGGYGVALLETVGKLLYVLADSKTWPYNNPNRANFFAAVPKSIQPFIYKGAMMNMVRGRGIADAVTDEYTAGLSAMEAIAELCQFAPPEDALRYKSLLKYLVSVCPQPYFASRGRSLNGLVIMKSIMSDSSVVPANEPDGIHHFPCMDRTVLFRRTVATPSAARNGWAFAISMTSTREARFEYILLQDKKGWYTGQGMTFLYGSASDDPRQYSLDYFASVDPYRLPGTTVVASGTNADGFGDRARGGDPWVGGATFVDDCAAIGMYAREFEKTMGIRKSWFLLRDQVVCLGAGLTSTDGYPVETTIENRKLSWDLPLFINGKVLAGGTDGWSAKIVDVRSMWIGQVNKQGTGYYFPTASTVNGLREKRNKNWKDIGPNNKGVSFKYLTLWLDHGINPNLPNDAYSYVLLPNYTAAETAAYEMSPTVSVLENSGRLQAIRDIKTGSLLVNFWTDVPTTVPGGQIVCSGKASVILVETPASYEIAVADPTQLNTGTLEVTVTGRGKSVTTTDARTQVVFGEKTFTLAVNVKDAMGKTFHTVIAK